MEADVLGPPAHSFEQTLSFLFILVLFLKSRLACLILTIYFLATIVHVYWTKLSVWTLERDQNKTLVLVEEQGHQLLLYLSFLSFLKAPDFTWKYMNVFMWDKWVQIISKKGLHVVWASTPIKVFSWCKKEGSAIYSKYLNIYSSTYMSIACFLYFLWLRDGST